MYIVIKNENSNLINMLSVNIVKTLVGVFNREELENELDNINYDKAIVDLTSIKNYYDVNYLYNFLEFFKDQSNVIILFSEDFSNNNRELLSKLIEKGYYNLATNDSAVSMLLERNNNFDDVRKYLIGYDFLRIDDNDSDRRKNNGVESDINIIGIENGTKHAGSTTLMYMLVKEISKFKKVKGIEMFNNDSLYFKDDRIITCQSRAHFEIIVNTLKDIDIFIVDLNGSDIKDICTKVIYLVDPGTTKINKVVKGDQKKYEKLLNGNVVLNRSNIKNDNLKNFEYETHLKVVGNIPNLNERLDNIGEISDLVKFLVKNLKVKNRHGGLFSFLKGRK